MSNHLEDLAQAMHTTGTKTLGEFMHLAAGYGADTPAEVVAAYQQENPNE